METYRALGNRKPQLLEPPAHRPVTKNFGVQLLKDAQAKAKKNPGARPAARLTRKEAPAKFVPPGMTSGPLQLRPPSNHPQPGDEFYDWLLSAAERSGEDNVKGARTLTIFTL